MIFNKKAGIVGDITIVILILFIVGYILLPTVMYEDDDSGFTKYGCIFIKPQYNESGPARSCFTKHWNSYCREIAPSDCPDYNANQSKSYNQYNKK